jgi:DNA-binding NarL/FixJ family response regulator
MNGSGMGAEKTSMPKARILVVDDHPIVRSGLMRLIDQQGDMICCGEASLASEAQTAVEKLIPDLVILDLRLKGADGLELIKSLRGQYPGLKILILSQYDAPLYVERALHSGAMGYVVKEQAAEELIRAIRTVLAGEVYLTRAMAARFLRKFVGEGAKGPQAGIDQLTDRELHVLQSLGVGLSTRQIALELNLSIKTVETHRENIKRKLGLKGASELIHFANQWAREQVSVTPKMLDDAGDQLSPGGDTRAG